VTDRCPNATAIELDRLARALRHECPALQSRARLRAKALRAAPPGSNAWAYLAERGDEGGALAREYEATSRSGTFPVCR
jgi:hypothetical protein